METENVKCSFFLCNLLDFKWWTLDLFLLKLWIHICAQPLNSLTVATRLRCAQLLHCDRDSLISLLLFVAWKASQRLTEIAMCLHTHTHTYRVVVLFNAFADIDKYAVHTSSLWHRHLLKMNRCQWLFLTLNYLQEIFIHSQNEALNHFSPHGQLCN